MSPTSHVGLVCYNARNKVQPAVSVRSHITCHSYCETARALLQIVLLQNVPRLGSAGDLVTVRQGYKVNYLMPQGLAKPATAEFLACVTCKASS